LAHLQTDLHLQRISQYYTAEILDMQQCILATVQGCC